MDERRELARVKSELYRLRTEIAQMQEQMQERVNEVLRLEGEERLLTRVTEENADG